MITALSTHFCVTGHSHDVRLSRTKHKAPLGGCRSTPPMERPPGEVLPHLCRPLSAPTRCARGALAGSVAPRYARGLCGMRGRGPAGRIERRPRAASPPGGLAALAPGAPASPPSAASPRPPARPPAPVARGPGAPPGLAAAAARGAAARPRSGACCAAPAVLARWSGCAVVGLPLVALPPLRPPCLRARPAPGPPLRPRRCAAAARCALALAPPAAGAPGRRGAQRSRPLGRRRRPGVLARGVGRLFGARWWSVCAPAGAGLAAAPLVCKVWPSLPPPGASNVGLDRAAPHLRAFAMVRGAPARAL